jgi:pimeloyl-ACP methyl ester carboxylesterase
MLVDLVHVTTRDGVRLDGVYQGPARTTSIDVDGVILVHGTGSNFYGSTLFDPLAERLVGLGVGVLRVNTRGHDLMSTAATARGGRRFGAAYEVVDDCRHDLAAWIDLLQTRCGTSIALIGHSLGAVKCLYSQAAEPDPRVARLVAISPPRLSHSWFLTSDRAAEFRDAFDQARALVGAGEPEALMEVRIPLPFVVTAAGYVEKYGPDERYDYLKWIDKIACPTLVTFGAIEARDNMAFRDAAAAIAGVAPSVGVVTIDGADHFYTGVREALIDRVVAWLGG